MYQIRSVPHIVPSMRTMLCLIYLYTIKNIHDTPNPITIIHSPIHFCGSRYHCQKGIYACIHSAIHAVSDEAMPSPKIILHTPSIQKRDIY